MHTRNSGSNDQQHGRDMRQLELVLDVRPRILAEIVQFPATRRAIDIQKEALDRILTFADSLPNKNAIEA
jgi:hypothetical protein